MIILLDADSYTESTFLKQITIVKVNQIDSVALLLASDSS